MDIRSLMLVSLLSLVGKIGATGDVDIAFGDDKHNITYDDFLTNRKFYNQVSLATGVPLEDLVISNQNGPLSLDDELFLPTNDIRAYRRFKELDPIFTTPYQYASVQPEQLGVVAYQNY